MLGLVLSLGQEGQWTRKIAKVKDRPLQRTMQQETTGNVYSPVVTHPSADQVQCCLTHSTEG
jgi:hypothetical protein